ncbi:transposase [Bacillus sp. ISL-47]|uniref:transposase n=1 Tax=Bacillus sp. ISL-47 TaxID=2819130 RepID=UPI001BEAB0D5|nr:transposase [Bacillus sp. ISL-47]MBT2689240.1 transposase [Bacillus sp. ISL-47]MBT2708638.1 transposase [Pseudomonas sp. ISL-84]
MPRPLRIWFPGAMYHIVARGNRRAAIFHDQVDFQTYLAILEDVRSMMPFVLHSYCLMTNHLHLQLETTHHHIQYIMKEMHSRYAVYLNQRLRTDGHVFQGRYGAKLIETDAYFLEVSRYIHRNPLEAKMVSHLEDYRWSSYASYVNLLPFNPHVDHSKTLSFFREPVEEQYRKFVEKNKKKNEEGQLCVPEQLVLD